MTEHSHWPSGKQSAVIIAIDYHDIHGILTQAPAVAGRDKTLSAASVSCLLRLPAAQCASALGIAASFSGGLWGFIHDGSHTKKLHAARVAEGGVQAALLHSAASADRLRYLRRAGAAFCKRWRVKRNSQPRSRPGWARSGNWRAVPSSRTPPVAARMRRSMRWIGCSGSMRWRPGILRALWLGSIPSCWRCAARVSSPASPPRK